MWLNTIKGDRTEYTITSMYSVGVLGTIIQAETKTSFQLTGVLKQCNTGTG